jgi:leader peptidase (prepilin peptidase)/N-methyltransferase
MIDIFILIVGWLSGSLTNYLVVVLPRKRMIGYPVCYHCESRINFLNYIILSKRCPSCGRMQSWRSWITNIIFVICTVFLWLSPPNNIGFVIGLCIVIYLAIVVLIDIEFRVILHSVSIFGALFCFSIGIWQHGLVRTLSGGIVGYCIMLFLYYLGLLLIRIRTSTRKELTEKEAIGFGDVNLGGVIGLLLGWPGVLLGIILTILSSGLVSIIYIIIMLYKKQYSSNLSIPYGPFIALGALLLYFG